MSSEIDDTTDCSVWAADNGNNVVLPTGEIPVKNLPPESEYDGLFEGGKLLEEYETKARAMEDLHEEWRDVALEWSNRMDQLFAQIIVLERTLRDKGTAPPADDFEDITSRIIGFYAASGFGIVQGGVSIGKFAFARKKTFASAGTQTTATQASAGSNASAISRGARASKMTKLKTLGRVTVGLGTVLSLTVIAVDLANRNKSLREAIPKFHKWLYGPDDDNPENLIAEPDITTDDITVGGAAGRILEMRRAVAEIHEAIRTLARLEGIATRNPDDTDRDMNLVYCETRQAVGDSIYDASQVMAASRVALRMLCIDRYTAGTSYSDVQIAAVTGLSELETGALRTQVNGEDGPALCPGIAPGTGGT
jgi:hypothetical protein